MEFPRLGLLALVAASLLCASGCIDDGPANPLDASVDNAIVTANVASDAGAPFTVPANCVAEDQSVQRAPSTLECTGLFASLADKSLNKGVQPFTPAHALWSDGAEKHRWIYLPEGQQIDTSDPDAWSFPIGTRVWKEFKHTGKRVETRFFRKVSKTLWLSATYLWNQDDSAAAAFAGGEVPVSGGTYYVPTDMQCEQCHRGSPDQLLGFSPVLLGLAGAEGVTLADLVAGNRLSKPPAHTSFTIPDDGTGLAAPALGWLHVNCGVGCHNATPAAMGGVSRMYLRIAASALDTMTPVQQWDDLKTTVDVGAHIADFAGRKRIVAGQPDQSLLVELASTRGTNQQMPPIATKLVDPVGIKAVRDWIAALGGKKPVDMDAAVQPDTSVPVTPVADAGVGDGGPNHELDPDAALPTVAEDGGTAMEADAGLPAIEVDASLPVAPVEDASPPVVEPVAEDASSPAVEVPDAEIVPEPEDAAAPVAP